MSYKSQSNQRVGGVKTEKSPPSCCVKEARTCVNYAVKCSACLKIQGKYTEYKGR